MDLDVVIATSGNLNKNYSLYYVVRSILSQTIRPNKVYIVFNDDSISIKGQLKKDFGDLIEILDGSKKKSNISFARNLGADISEADLVLFMDDDMVVGDTDVFERIIQRMEYLDFYCGASRFWSKLEWFDQLQKNYSINHILNILRATSLLPKSIDRLSGKLTYHHRSFIGNFGCVKKDVFTNVGGFDEKYYGWSYQDTDLMMKFVVNNMNYQIMADNLIKVYHLSHGVKKGASKDRNKILFEENQRKLRVKFHLNNFFGDFDDNYYSIITPL